MGVNDEASQKAESILEAAAVVVYDYVFALVVCFDGAVPLVGFGHAETPSIFVADRLAVDFDGAGYDAAYCPTNR